MYVDTFVTISFVSVMFKNGKYPSADSKEKTYIERQNRSNIITEWND
jgi:hypothetical protein